jgi:hypothetical protein
MCLASECGGNFNACMNDSECSSLYSCYGGCAFNAGYNTCINACWEAATPNAQFIWFGTYICALDAGCYDNPAQSWPGYASAEESARRWALRNGCDETTVLGPEIDIVFDFPGNDTQTIRHENCPEGRDAEVWKIPYGSHVPYLNDNWSKAIVDWLMNQSK